MLLYLAVFVPDASIKVTVVKGVICASSRFGFQMITCEQKIVLKLGVVCIFILWISRSSSILTIFSSPDPKGHVSYCHHWASVVRPFTFHILINSTEDIGPIWTKLWWNGSWMAPFQNYVWWSRFPTKMATKLK